MTNVLPMVLAITLSAASTQVHARTWECKNDIEVHCDANSCTSNSEVGSFTPMEVNFSASGYFSVCAYSGCWEGNGKVASRKPFLIIWKAQAAWSDPNRKIEGREDIIIAFDPKDGLALLKVAGFSVPLHCVLKETYKRRPEGE